MVTIERSQKSTFCLPVSLYCLSQPLFLKAEPKTKVCMQSFIWEVIPGNGSNRESKQERKINQGCRSWTSHKYQCLILMDLLWSLIKCASELSLKWEKVAPCLFQLVGAQCQEVPSACQKEQRGGEVWLSTHSYCKLLPQQWLKEEGQEDLAWEISAQCYQERPIVVLPEQ